MPLENKHYKYRDTVNTVLFWLMILDVLLLGVYMNHLCEPLPVFQGTVAFQETSGSLGKGEDLLSL